MNGLLSALETPSATEETLDQEALKIKFLKCLVAEKSARTALRAVVFTALHSGIGWRQLLDWATEAGHTEQHVRKVLSAIYTEAGIRRRRPGAGRQTPPEALTLVAYARSRYGDRAVNLLRAAYRAARAQTTAVQSSLPQQDRLLFRTGISPVDSQNHTFRTLQPSI